MEKLRLVDSHCHLHGGYEGLDAFFAATNALMDGAGLEKVNVAMAPSGMTNILLKFARHSLQGPLSRKGIRLRGAGLLPARRGGTKSPA